MSLTEDKQNNSNVEGNGGVRRTFLKRASAGAVIASIPGRSAWAGIAGSIVASGHGSDFNQGASTKLLGKDGFNANNYSTTSFESIFGGKPFRNNGNVRGGNLTFKQILNSNNSNEKGKNDVNVGLVLMYLNAVNHDGFTIVYPVLTQHNNSEHDFAIYLYSAALADPGGVGILLNNTISTYS